MRRFARTISIIVAALILSGCAIRKYVPEGSSLLSNTKIEIEGNYDEISKSSVSKQISQQPMESLFGWYPMVWVYYKTQPKVDKKFFKWVNEKVGRKPVYYSIALESESRDDIITYLNNIGFFKSEVSSSAEIKNFRAKVTYKVKPSQPYIIRNLKYNISDSAVAKHIKQINEKLPVKVGKNYNAYDMDDQRDIILEYLRNNGYYYFTKNNITFVVDTNFNSHRADVTMYIKGNTDKYVIDNVFINPNFKVNDTIAPDTTAFTFKFGKKSKSITFNFIHRGDPKMNFSTFNQVIQIHPGEFYSSKKVSNTYHTLGRLPIYGQRTIRFDTVPSAKNDTVKHLNCLINVQKGKLNAYNLQFEATNSAGNFGMEGSFTYKNKNIFHGSELLTAKVKGAYQIMNSSVVSSGRFHCKEFGVEVGITFPRFIGPFKMKHFVNEYQPQTNVSAGYDIRVRPLYTRQTFLASYGHNWMTNSNMQHSLTPININMVKVDRTSDFDKYLEANGDQRLKEQYSSHIIAGLSYAFVYNNQSLNIFNDFFYFKGDIETSGNVLSLFNGTNLYTTVDGHKELFGVQYSQYVKLTADFRYHHYLKYGSLAFRLMGGYGIPYGNSTSMPFEKNYNAGGANSMRGWSYRRLGPGAYDPQGKNIDCVGNIQIEFNAEYRFPIYKFLQAAVFTDIGNVWNSRPVESFPNSVFQFNTFYKELAMDMGLGIRLDFSFFLLRFDFAIPYRDPKYAENERWRFKYWQWSDIAFSFGIGFPF